MSEGEERNTWLPAPTDQPARNEASYEQWPDTRSRGSHDADTFEVMVCGKDGEATIISVLIR